MKKYSYSSSLALTKKKLTLALVSARWKPSFTDGPTFETYVMEYMYRYSNDLLLITCLNTARGFYLKSPYLHCKTCHISYTIITSFNLIIHSVPVKLPYTFYHSLHSLLFSWLLLTWIHSNQYWSGLFCSSHQPTHVYKVASNLKCKIVNIKETFVFY